MEFRELSVEARSVSGSSASKQLRREGNLPGVIYCGGGSALAVSLDTHSFVQTAKKSNPSQIFKFKSQDKGLDGMLALVKDIQVEPIKEKVLHVDFLSISEGHEIVLAIQIELVGECPAVKLGDAILSQPRHELEVACLPGNIPQFLEVDISGLKEGDSIHAGDLKMPEGVRLKSGGQLTLVSAVSAKEQTATADSEGVAEGGAEVAATSTEKS